MKARVQKWGNSLGIRIPKVLAQEVSLHVDAEVEMTGTEGRIVIVPVRNRHPTLRQLLSLVAEDNLHGEIGAGGSLGKEDW